MQDEFFINEISENISQKFHDQWKVRYHWSTFNWKVRPETDLNDFVDEFDNRHDHLRIMILWSDDDIKF